MARYGVKMSWFHKDAKDRAKLTRAAVERTRSNIMRINTLLHHMDTALYKIEHDLPPNASGEIVRPLQRTMELTERHSEQTLVHMQHIEQHIAHLEEHAREAIHPK